MVAHKVTAQQILSAKGLSYLSDVVREGARLAAVADYRKAEAADFSAEEVRDLGMPEWLGDVTLLFPVDALKGLGLQLRPKGMAHLYATCGVDEHVDDMDGLSVGVVLHSDGFTFKSAGQTTALAAGDWFVFDDRLVHEVREMRTSTSLLVLTAPLEQG